MNADREIASMEAEYERLNGRGSASRRDAERKRILAAAPLTDKKPGSAWQSWVDDDGQFHEVQTGVTNSAAGTGTCDVPGCRVNHTALARPRPGAGLSPAQQGRTAMAGHAERLVGGLRRRDRWPGY